MKHHKAKWVLGLLLFVVAVGEPVAQAIAHEVFATCLGKDPCKACKNCKYCKHCAKDGGTCGICK